MNIKFEIIVTINILLGLISAYVYGQNIENVTVASHILTALIWTISVAAMLIWIEYCVMIMIKKLYKFTLKSGK